MSRRRLWREIGHEISLLPLIFQLWYDYLRDEVYPSSILYELMQIVRDKSDT